MQAAVRRGRRRRAGVAGRAATSSPACAPRTSRTPSSRPRATSNALTFEAPIELDRVDGLGDLRVLHLRGRGGAVRGAATSSRPTPAPPTCRAAATTQAVARLDPTSRGRSRASTREAVDGHATSCTCSTRRRDEPANAQRVARSRRSALGSTLLVPVHRAHEAVALAAEALVGVGVGLASADQARLAQHRDDGHELLLEPRARDACARSSSSPRSCIARKPQRLDALGQRAVLPRVGERAPARRPRGGERDALAEQPLVALDRQVGERAARGRRRRACATSVT